MERWHFYLICLGCYWLYRFIRWAIREASGSGNQAAPTPQYIEDREIPSGPKFKTKIKITHVKKEGSLEKKPIIEVLAIGTPPIKDMHIGSLISLFDITSGKEQPVLSSLDSRQEKESSCFQQSLDLGYFSGGTFSDWITIGKIDPQHITTEIGQQLRKLRVMVRLVNWTNPPIIKNGKVTANREDGIIWESKRTTSIMIPNQGYQENINNKMKARELSLKIGVGVAMSDGELHPSEGEVIKNWIIKVISPFEGSKQAGLKALYNNAFLESFNASKDGQLDIGELAYNLKKIGIKSCEYEAIELSHKIMSADGVIDKNEVRIIKNLTNIFGINQREIEDIRSETGELELSGNQLLQTLGINPNLSKDEIKKKLSMEFQKWNNRLNIVAIEKRAEVQSMIDKIAIARGEYD